MFKLLIDTPSGVQVIEEYDEGGGYFDPARVVWDERRDGKLPAVVPGGLAKQGNALVIDPAKKAAHDAAKAAADSEKAKVSAKKALLKDKNAKDKDRLDALIEHLGLDL